MPRQLNERERLVVAIGAFAILACIAYALIPFSITYHFGGGSGFLSFVGPLNVTANCGSAVAASVHHDISQCEDAARSRLFTSAILMLLIAASAAITVKFVLPALPASRVEEETAVADSE